MRALKNSLFFLLGVLLVGVPMLVFAETIPAQSIQQPGVISMWGDGRGTGWTDPDPVALCTRILKTAAVGAVLQPLLSSSSEPYRRKYCAWVRDGVYNQGLDFPIVAQGTQCPSGMSYNNQTNVCTGQGCPANQDWTFNQSSNTCTRPDCPSGQSRDPSTGKCDVPQCQLSANAQIGTTRYQLPWPQPNGVTWCIQNCVAYPVPPFNVQGNTAFAYFAVNGAGGAASTCTGSTTTPDTVPNPTTTADPPCNPGDGALAVGQGVKCVPSTTPGATVPPKTSQQQQKQTFPDGSTSTTTITQTCTGEGACSTTTINNVTGPSGNPSGTGQAGAPGTTSGKSDKPAADQPDFCKANPNLQICKGNIAEEGTQKKILEGVESITKPTITDDSSLTEKGQFKESEELKNADKDATDRATGSIDPVSAPKSVWESAMSSGFWGPIPQSGCSPHSSKIGPFQWSFDPCPIASKISDIGAYALWVILAISTFVMLTGGRKA